MSFLSLIILLTAQANKLVEYHFGLNYGTVFYDSSLNLNHGYILGSSKIKFTDRGIYFRGNTDTIDVKQFDLPPTMSVLLWILPKSGDGLIYFEYGIGSYGRLIKVYVKRFSEKLGIQISNTKYLEEESLPDGDWRLILITKSNDKYSLRTEKDSTVELESTVSSNIAIGGYFTSKSFKGYVWYFAVFDEVIDLTLYFSTADGISCLLGKCDSCSLAVVDPFYGTICISTEKDEKKDAQSIDCSSKSYGCSDWFTYNCECSSNSCYYNIKSETYGCVNLTEVTNCTGSFVNRNGKCCIEQCETCDSSTVCITCIDPLANVTNGTCLCMDSYFGDVSISLNTTCEKCSDTCGLCLGSYDYCLTCSDSNAEAVNGTCFCKDGYYNENDSSDSNLVCKQCNNPCVLCSDTYDYCLSCSDGNADAINGTCLCKDGYYYENISNDSIIICKQCMDVCGKCVGSSNFCLTCSDTNAEAVDGICSCKDGYYDEDTSDNTTVTCKRCMDVCEKCVISSNYCLTCTSKNSMAKDGKCLCNDGYYDEEISDEILSCKECSSGCKKCTGLLMCTECFDQNATIVDGNCACKAGMYGAVSSVSFESGCSICHADCTECTDYAYCTKCSNSRTYPLDGICLCKDSYYKLPDKPVVTCSPCNNDCKKCIDQASCTECNSKYAVPHNNQGCICQQSYFNTSSLAKYSSCQKCADLCLTCSSLDYCTECTGINTQLVSNKCTCIPGYYYSGRPSNDCIICTDYKVSETCRLNCAKGTGWYKGQCVECKEYCLDCDDDLMCLECTDGMQIVNGICECFRAEVIIDRKCEPKYFNVTISIGIDYGIKLEFSENTEILLGNEHFKLYFYGDSQEFEVSGTDFKNYIIKETKFGSFLQTTKFNLKIAKVLYSNENSQLIDYEFSGYFSATPLTPFAAAIKSTTKSVMTVTFASAMVSNPAACWILINTIQIITYLPLTLLNYPSDILEFLKAIGDYSIIPNIMPNLMNKDSSSQPIARLQKSGIESSVFWVNVGPNAIILLFYIIFSPFIYLGSKLPYTYEICQEMLKNFRYNLFIRFWTETYLELGLFSLIQIESVTFIQSINTDDGYFNLITAIIFIFLVCLTPIYVFYLLYSNKNRLNEIKVNQRIGSLYCEFKNDRGIASSLFYLVFFIRRLQYVMTQILLSDYWYVQYGLNLFFTLFQFGYFLYFKPFKNKLMFYSELIGESCVVVLFVYSGFLFPNENIHTPTSIISSVFIYTVMFSLGMQTLLSTTSLVVVIKSWYSEYKKYKLKKEIKKANKIYPEKSNIKTNDIFEISQNPCLSSIND